MPEEQQERLAAWLTSQLARSFKPAERTVFVALAELERPMQSMADMPDADAVARQAEQTAQELHAYLNNTKGAAARFVRIRGRCPFLEDETWSKSGMVVIRTRSQRRSCRRRLRS